MGSQLKRKEMIISTSATIVTKRVADSSKLIVLGFLESFVGLAYICAKQTRRAKMKLWAACSKRLMKHKALRNGEDDVPPLWKRTILMGDKCQPLDFSGVIYSSGGAGRSGRKVAEQLTPPVNPSPGDRHAKLYLLD